MTRRVDPTSDQLRKFGRALSSGRGRIRVAGRAAGLSYQVALRIARERFGHKPRKRQAKNDALFEDLSKAESWEWIYYLWADGCLVDPDGGTNYRRIQVKVSAKAPVILQRCAAAFGIKKPPRQTIGGGLSKQGREAVAKRHPQLILSINSGLLARRLERIGFRPHKAASGPPPLPPALCYVAALRGYFNGDGTFSMDRAAPRRQATIGFVGNKATCEQLGKMLRQVVPGLRQGTLGPTRSIWSIKWGGRDQVARIYHALFEEGQMPIQSRRHGRVMEWYRDHGPQVPGKAREPTRLSPEIELARFRAWVLCADTRSLLDYLRKHERPDLSKGALQQWMDSRGLPRKRWGMTPALLNRVMRKTCSWVTSDAAGARFVGMSQPAFHENRVRLGLDLHVPDQHDAIWEAVYRSRPGSARQMAERLTAQLGRPVPNREVHRWLKRKDKAPLRAPGRPKGSKDRQRRRRAG